MKLNSAQLEAFTAVVKVMSFTKAAAMLHVTQSALSQRIAKLEEELETTLFIRDRAAIRLTEAGEKVLRFCQLSDGAESELLSSLKTAQEGFAGVLRIGGFSSVNRSLVIPALRKLVCENPRLSIDLQTRELSELPVLLKSATVDYILTTEKTDVAGTESVFLGYKDNVLVCSKRYPRSEIYLDHDEGDLTTKRYFSQNKLKFKPMTMRYLDEVYGLIDGVKNGYGVAILPKHLIEGERDLKVIEPKRVLRTSVYLQYYSQPYYRRVHSAFLSEMQGFFKLRLRQDQE